MSVWYHATRCHPNTDFLCWIRWVNTVGNTKSKKKRKIKNLNYGFSRFNSLKLLEKMKSAILLVRHLFEHL